MEKAEVINELRKFAIIGEGRVIFKVLNYSQNGLAPEKVAYRIHYPDCNGERRSVTYYPNTVGFQWSK